MALLLYKIVKSLYVILYFYFFPILTVILIYFYKNERDATIYYNYKFEVIDLWNGNWLRYY
jgi:hypothetical protein